MGEQDGGYSTFRVNLISHLKEENRLKVLMNNAANGQGYPQKADFTFYGRIYRELKLIMVPETHFNLDHCGSIGVKVETEIIQTGEEAAGTTAMQFDGRSLENEKALVRLTAYITGKAEKVRFVLFNGMSTETEVKEHEAKAQFLIENVRLWNGTADAYLYMAVIQW